MKFLKSINSLKGIITRFSLIICLGLCLNFHSFSNPIENLPEIMEIYFTADGWSIELVITEFYGETNLDDVRITGLYDTAQFLPGIEYTPGEAFFVTQADFQTPLYINQAGDCLYLEVQMGNSWWRLDFYGLSFGDFPLFISDVCAPVGEESIALQEFAWSNGGPYFWTVKELPNSIGSSPGQVSKRCTFSGYVRDKNNEPLAGIKLDYCSFEFYHYTTPTVPEIFTDQDGYFFTDNMFCKRYHFRFLYEGGEIGDTLICLEPDTPNYFEFKLDTLLTGTSEYKPAIPGYSIINIPNPLALQTSFIVEAKGQIKHQKGVIKIYSSEGYIVDILPIEISGEKQELIYNPADKPLSSGIYFYSLEIGSEKKASGKMVVNK